MINDVIINPTKNRNKWKLTRISTEVILVHQLTLLSGTLPIKCWIKEKK
jgi:hypothetical protein